MKHYWLKFGQGDPASKTGLTPTFILFQDTAGDPVTPPSIDEPGSNGLYHFSFDPTESISFVVDGGASLPDIDRYVAGYLDPNQKTDELVTAADGSVAVVDGKVDDLLAKVGTTADSFGDSSTDPSTLFAFLKRLQELQEGDASFDKATGVWTIKDRGSLATLRVKTLTNGATEATKV